MNIEVSEPAAAEGTTLPPPRHFGECNTMTLPRGRKSAAGREMDARGVEAGIGAGAAHARIAIVPANAAPLTITLQAASARILRARTLG